MLRTSGAGRDLGGRTASITSIAWEHTASAPETGLLINLVCWAENAEMPADSSVISMPISEGQKPLSPPNNSDLTAAATAMFYLTVSIRVGQPAI
jgi:hypothetical protein